MAIKAFVVAATAAAIGLAAVVLPGAARADGIFDMMNPFEWFVDDDDWDDWRYRPAYWDGGPYGWGGPYAWGAPYGGHTGPKVVVVVPEASQSETGSRLPE